MSCLANVVVPGLSYHVPQRGSGRTRMFSTDADDALYRDLLAQFCRATSVSVRAWVLMPNHVPLVVVPADGNGLRRALAPTHRANADHVQAQRRRTGHF